MRRVICILCPVLVLCFYSSDVDAQNAYPWESAPAQPGNVAQTPNSAQGNSQIQSDALQPVQQRGQMYALPANSGATDFGVRRQTMEEYQAERALNPQAINRTNTTTGPTPAPPRLPRTTLFASARQDANSTPTQVPTQPALQSPPTQQTPPAPQAPSAPQTEVQSVIGGDASAHQVQGQIQNDAVQQTQPSLSDPADYEFNTVPSPPEGYAPANIQSPAPRLNVYDRASEDDGGPNYCNRNCRKPCQLGCVKRLFGTSPRGVEVGGWAQFGYHNRDTILYNNRRTEFSPHQIWLYAEKAACRDSCDWDIGYRLDGLYGLDAQDLQAFGNSPTGAPDGWDNDWDHGSFGSALPQAYLQMANADWDVKLGKFFGPFGYETPAAPGNFFYSHSYTNYYNEPRTMSGILGERRVSENQSLLFGATAGWDSAFESNESGVNVITGTRMSLSPNVNIAMTTSLGDTGSLGSGIFSSAVSEIQLTQDLQYVFQFNNYNLNSSHSYAVVQYLFRQINPCLGLGARLEWWKSDLLFADTKSTYEFTMGANYRPHANVIFRPEVRFDWGAAAISPGQPIVGFDAIILF